MTEENEVVEEVMEDVVEETVVELADDPQPGSNEVEEVVEASAEAEEEVPAYTPDYTYKVNKEVREIPEHYRSLLTDVEQEKQFRDIMERADGIHDVKAHRDRLTKEIDEQYKPSMEILNTANSFLEKNDLESYFEYSGLTDKQIYQYALKRLEMQENPEQMAQHNQFRQLQNQNMQLQQQFDSMSQQNSQQAVANRQAELDSHLAGTETHAMVQAYDAQVGKPGAFRAEVIRRGQYYGQVENRDASVEELVNEVSAPYRGFMQPKPQAQPAVTPSGVVTGGGNQRGKPTLPKIQGKGGSPVSKGPKSLDDLKKLRNQMLGL